MGKFSKPTRCTRVAAVQIGPSACVMLTRDLVPAHEGGLPSEIPAPAQHLMVGVDAAIGAARTLGAALVVLPAHIGTFLYYAEQQWACPPHDSEAASPCSSCGPTWPEVAIAARTGRTRVWDAEAQSYVEIDVVDTYMRFLSRAAAKHQVYLAGGTLLSSRETPEKSAPVPAPPLNRGYLFGPDGTLIGTQAQTHLTQEEKSLGFGRAESLSIFHTDIGAIGMAIGTDVWVPEVFRILSLMGADIIVCPVAVEAPYNPWHQVRGVWQEVQQNQVFGVEACLVGDMFGKTYEGRSSILTSVEASEDGSGFLAHVADPARELAAEAGSTLPPHIPVGGPVAGCKGDGAAGDTRAADDPRHGAPAALYGSGPRTRSEAVLVADLSYERLEAARKAFPIFGHFNCGLYRRRMPQVYGAQVHGGNAAVAGAHTVPAGTPAGSDWRRER